MSSELPLSTRVWFAWVCFFKVLFDAPFAARAWQLRTPALPPSAPKTPPAPVLEAAPVGAALQLLSLLQREGRFVDFVQQDVTSFADADIGVAARVVHEGCRRALKAHLKVEPVRAEDEGEHVTLAAGFNADEVKLVGDVKGEPPFAGVVRHRGWRVSSLTLPQTVGGHDARIIAPAEIEIV